MQKRETLAQLIYRTVLEFEQHQAALQQESLSEKSLPCPNLNTTSQLILQDTKPKRQNRKRKIV